MPEKFDKKATTRYLANMFLARALHVKHLGIEVPDYVIDVLHKWVSDTDSNKSTKTGFEDKVSIGDFASLDLVDTRPKNN